ncbi:PAN-3 domain-containing protein [Caenorhabditis elegans]|uniref:PAN-3 domain-containing protein n=1 Tax=Caenorhabditis elegans TaxID=6239 RepID=G5EBP6_CAEEL|nr:PAN-3 domain-containing protein [Caenorhabditis elegans]CAB07710.2 PAN-3 domain-containing protein [Caenorhabditis elegans]|eukprot:NP_507917.2 C-type LECtin [Caenorhabditis elegans]
MHIHIMYLLFVILIPKMLSLQMIVTYGKPTNFTDATSFSESSWESCVEECYLQNTCVLAYSPTSPLNCQLYPVNRIFSVQKLYSTDLVAFKVTNSTATCPTGDNPPTFGNLTNYGSISTDLVDYTYSVSYGSDDTWSLSYNLTGRVCADGWSMFVRPTTNWCLQVFGSPSVSYTQADAIHNCTNIGTVLSGLETLDERDFVAAGALTLLGAGYPEFAAVWVSGMRKPECYSDGWENLAECAGTNMEQFTYTDTYMANYAGYTWDPNTPDRNSTGVWQNCIQMWIRIESVSPDFPYDTNPNGNSDDATCNVADSDDFSLRGFACGKLPEIPADA